MPRIRIHFSSVKQTARYNEMMIARMNRDKESAQYKSRTSRLEKWRELVKQAQKSLEVPVAAPEGIVHLSLMRKCSSHKVFQMILDVLAMGKMHFLAIHFGYLFL